MQIALIFANCKMNFFSNILAPLQIRELFNKDSKKLIVAFVYCCLALSITYYFGSATKLYDILYSDNQTWFLAFKNYFLYNESAELNQKKLWVAVIIIFQFVIPFILMKYTLKINPVEHCLSTKSIVKHSKIYLLFICIMIPIVFFISKSPSFIQKYPMYQPEKGHLWPTFMYWELLYLIQFLGLEFFFRGFLIHSVKKNFGIYSILISVIPYCMIHFGKPFAETISAIVAGMVLGLLSYRTNSIILGIVIHFTVAVAMDFCALWREGYF